MTSCAEGAYADLPKLEDITARPEIVCSSCIVDELTLCLKNFRSDFDEGIVLPYNGEGVFLPMIVQWHRNRVLGESNEALDIARRTMVRGIFRKRSPFQDPAGSSEARNPENSSSV